MKVISKQATSAVTFKDIGYGQIFVSSQNEVYMKLDCAYHCHDEDGDEWAVWTAVHLESGELCEFFDHNEVTVPNKVIPIEVTY